MRELLERPFGMSSLFSSENQTKVLLLKQSLTSDGVAPDSYKNGPDTMWKDFLEEVLPYIVGHGVEEGVLRYRRVLNGQEEEE